MVNPRIWTLSLLLLVLGIAEHTSASAQEPRQPEWLKGVDRQVQQVMDEWGVPGLALGVVTDSSVVLTKGYGRGHVEADAPVTDQTLFAIGSTTKAFTAAVLGMMHDEEALDWSAPVRTYLPRFRLKDPVASREITPLDLLTHRSGLPGHDALWGVTDLPREELVARLRYLEPSEPFRTTFQYQNLMYTAAGHLAGQVAGSTWEETVQSRLFAPLGMTRSTFSVTTMQETDDYARPYGDALEDYDRIDYRNIDPVGPAGSINSSVAEMTSWVRLFLNEGRHDGTQVIEAETIAELTRPRIVWMDFPVPFTKTEEVPYHLYGLGWVVESYHGHRHVWHTGGIDGFSAIVSLLPDRDVGWVLLTNKDDTEVPLLLTYELVDRVLGRDGPDWSRRVADALDRGEDDESGEEGGEDDATDADSSNAQPSHPPAAYAGTYEHPGYGTLTVEATTDSMRGRYGTLSGPLRHRQHDTFALRYRSAGDTLSMPLHFDTSMDGTVDAVEVPMEPAVDPIVFSRSDDE
ncbi:serine hydrolase [Salinibacter ruber]|uniref:serine hydrolase n=1 Tax=Salinibacter ruber TaxID=146919 RepID=UPI000E577FD8|nr:serine hydrolase [Salinibacter ruber]